MTDDWFNEALARGRNVAYSICLGACDQGEHPFPALLGIIMGASETVAALSGDEKDRQRVLTILSGEAGAPGMERAVALQDISRRITEVTNAGKNCLADIEPDPDAARMPPAMSAALRMLRDAVPEGHEACLFHGPVIDGKVSIDAAMVFNTGDPRQWHDFVMNLTMEQLAEKAVTAAASKDNPQ